LMIWERRAGGLRQIQTWLPRLLSAAAVFDLQDLTSPNFSRGQKMQLFTLTIIHGNSFEPHSITLRSGHRQVLPRCGPLVLFPALPPSASRPPGKSRTFKLEAAEILMYVSSMKGDTYPLALPPDLLAEVRRTAKATGLSMADAMRQSMKLGLPKLKEQLCRLR